MAIAGTCEKCQGQKMIVLIYGEKAEKPPTRGIHIDYENGARKAVEKRINSSATLHAISASDLMNQ
jgi:hypothetical protein